MMINAMGFISFPMSRKRDQGVSLGRGAARTLSMNTIPPIPKHQVNSRNSRGGVEGYIDGEWQGTNCGDMPRWAL